MAFFVILFMALAGYGASIDRVAMLIGAMPGFIGLCGLCVWATGPDADLAYQVSSMRASQKRCDALRKAMRTTSRKAHYSVPRAGR